MSAGSVAIVDSWAALALLRKEEPASTVMRRFVKRASHGNIRLVMSLINLGEVYYRMIAIVGEAGARDRLNFWRQLPVQIAAVREPIVMEAGRLKAKYRLSYADAFAVATAREEGGAVITGDPEILALPRTVVRVARLERASR